MKKQIAAAVSVLLLAGLAAMPASAAGGVYTFEEYGFQCQVPDALYVFTQDMAEDDPLFEQFGITYQDEMDYLTLDGSNTIMNMNDALVSFELDLDVYEDAIFGDFSANPQEDLQVLGESYAEVVYSDEGYEVQEVYIKTYAEVPYLFIRYTSVEDDIQYDMLNCQTVVNGLNYVYNLYAYTETVTDAQIGYLESILNSSSFTTPRAPAAEAPADTSADTPAAGNTAVALVTANSNLITSIIGGCVGGLLAGLIPLIVGLKKRQKVLAWVGFGICVVCGGVLGLLLALPVAIIFLIIILIRGRKQKKRYSGRRLQKGRRVSSSSSGREPWDLPPQSEDPFALEDDPWDN